jgi:hypothetical protein
MYLEDELRSKIKSLFFNKELEEEILTEEGEDEEESIFDDTEDEDTENTEDGDESEESQEDDTESEETDDSEEELDLGDEEIDDTEEDLEPEVSETLESKIKSLFTDTGNPEVDWSISSENNTRLATFKFKAIGIIPNELMTEEEKSQGIYSDVLESRLTPEQKFMYKENIKKLRNDYPLLSEREKNIILWNAKIPIMAKTGEGEILNIYENNDFIKQAFEKIDEFLTKRFDENWQDDKDAIEFIRDVKINFTKDKSKITPNLMMKNDIIEKNKTGGIIFNKLNTETPEPIVKFVRENFDKDDFKTSSIFNTFANDFTETGGISRGSFFPIIKGIVEESEESGSEEDEESDDDFGGDFGGDSGDDSGDDFGVDLDIGDDSDIEGDEEEPDLGDEEEIDLGEE